MFVIYAALNFCHFCEGRVLCFVDDCLQYQIYCFLLVCIFILLLFLGGKEANASHDEEVIIAFYIMIYNSVYIV